MQGAGRWDKRRLAYEVSGRREGTYILMYFSGGANVMGELDRLFRIGDDVFRHLIVRVEPERIDTSRLQRTQPSAEEPAEEPAQEGAEEAAESAVEPAAEAVTEEQTVEAEAQTPAETETSAEEAPAPEPEETAAPADEEKVEETSSEGSNDQPKKEDE